MSRTDSLARPGTLGPNFRPELPNLIRISMLHLLESLTPEQQQAVTHVDGPLLILAGPGSGKTRVVTHRIAHLLHSGVPAWQVLALTFTNKAAQEMQARLDGLAPGERVWVSTFHRFCSRLLRQHASMVGLPENFTIYDTGDSRRVLERTLEELDLDAMHFTPQRIAASISWSKNHLITADGFEPRTGSPLDRIIARVYPAYQKRLLESAAVDFDDLLLHVARLLRENPEVRRSLDERYRYVLVDEYQDTNLAQYAIVRALSIDHPNLAVTGDPDQSIYGWRGANLGNILDFESDYPDVKIVRLEQNWRSTKRILRAADALIAHNIRRKEKVLRTDNEEGPPVRLVAYPTQNDEAGTIAARIAQQIQSGRRRPRDFAIFYRINALSRALEFALREEGIPYQMVNGLEFYQRKEIKDVLAYLHLINNPRDDVAFLRIVNTPPRGIGRTTIARLKDHAARYGLTLLDAAREAGLIETLNKRAATKVAKFVTMQDQLREVAMAPLEEIIGHVLEASTYRNHLAESESEDDLERLANIEELLTAARQFDEQNPGVPALEVFLEQASLVNDTDAWEADTDKVTLMTMHAAKGLEFPVVFIAAVEDGLLPHERSRDEPDQLEEERRLLFVGITRAMEELHLSLSQYREFRGRARFTVPSQFLMELPRDEMDIVEPKRSLFGPTFSRQSEPQPRPSAADDFPFGKLTTAADMDASASTAVATKAKQTSAPGASPDDFYQGQAVKHPEYGLGKIVALSGSGFRRMATVNFATSGQKKFILDKSPLQPASAR